MMPSLLKATCISKMRSGPCASPPRIFSSRSSISRTGTPALFVHPAGNRLNYPAVQQMFRVLLGRAGIRARSERCRPTIHGLRHSFAVSTLIRWYREGADVQARLPQLSTWLGHADPKWTYAYLWASPELLALAAERLEPPPRTRS